MMRSLNMKTWIVLGTVLLSAPVVSSRATEVQKPNIVYILCDDLGYGDVQCLNPKRGRISTPHFDRIAAEGMIFKDAHSGSSVCTPTRYGLLTGRYAWRTRLQQGVLDGGNDEPLIAAERLTVARLLQQHGYHTACIGKWHLGFQSDSQTAKQVGSEGIGGNGLPVGARIIGGPITRGFDHFYGCSNARTMSSLIENDRVIEALPTIEMLPRLESQAVDYIRNRSSSAKSGKPFFLYLPLTSPHTPIVPATEWQGKSGLGEYADFVMQTDAVVGKVLSALDMEGLADNTMVFFTSDNGCSPQAKVDKLEDQGHFPSAQFRGYKADIWEGGHRVPFFVRWPGKVKPGSLCDQVICHSDFLATCAEILGVRLPDDAGEDSISILPALLGTDTNPIHEAVVHHSIQGRFAIRQGDWKLEFCPGSGGWGKPGDADSERQGLPSIQLYNLREDIAEKRNVQSGNQELVQRLTRLLDRYIDDGRSTPGAKQRNDTTIVVNKRQNKKNRTDE
jgi:arylsulfatase A